MTFAQTLDALGVTHHWPFDELSGDTFSDRVGGVDGDATGDLTVGGASLLPFEAGHSIGFVDAEDAIVDIPEDDSLKPSGSFTMGAIIRPEAFADWLVPLSLGSGPYLLVTADHRFGCGVNTGEGNIGGSTDPTLYSGNVYLVGMSYDLEAGEIRLYVNGQEWIVDDIPEGAEVSFFNGYGNSVGQGTADEDSQFQGEVDEVFVFATKALSADEWGELFDTYAAAPPVEFDQGFVRILYSGEPDTSDLIESAARTDYFLMLPWHEAARDVVKSVNPDAKCLVYQNLAAMISDRGPDGGSSTLINFDEADDHEEWFCHDSDAERLVFEDYPYLYALNLSDADAVTQLTANALAAIDGWDGLFLDDVNSTLDGHLDGSDVDEFPSDADYADAVVAALQAIRAAVEPEGKTVVANIGAWIANQEFGKNVLQNVDGGFEEYHVKFDVNSGDESTYRYWPGGWLGNVENQAYCERVGKCYLASTASLSGDRRAAMYGYASMLLVSQGRSAWGFHHDYTELQEWFDFFDTRLGAPIDPPLSPGDVDADRVFVRRFERALVAVNPTDRNFRLSVDHLHVRQDRTIEDGWLALPSHTAAVLPITSPVYDRLVELLAPQMTPELDGFCEAVSEMFREVEFYARDTVNSVGDPLDGWGILFDVDNPRLSDDGLRWLGQWVGEVIPVGASPEEARALIHGQPNKRRGTLSAIVDAAKATLTAPKTVIVRERDEAACESDPAYGLTMISYTSQTPHPSVTEAAIKAVLPAGLVLNYLVVDGQDWQSVKDNSDDYQAVFDTYDSWQAVRDDEAT